jgi:lincosamide nucleotidyltransferase A/C/D/E
MPLRPMAIGGWIDRSRWPQHVTVCSNFRCGPNDVDALAAILRRVAAAISLPAVIVGGDALFGPGGDVSVQLVESEDLHRLHGALWDAFGSAVPVEPVEPAYNGFGYRPHVTVVDGRRLEPGLALELPALLLVEVAPEHNESIAVAVAVAEVGKPEKAEPVSAARAAMTWSTLAKEGIRSWVIGGWGIDALAEAQTREHHDLDLFVLDVDLRTMLEYLESSNSGMRYLWSENRWHGALPSAFVADIAGVEVDVHVVALEGDAVRILSEHSIELPVGALSGSGHIAGRRVACATIEAQLLMHTGYDLTEKDLRDLELLSGLDI